MHQIINRIHVRLFAQLPSDRTQLFLNNLSLLTRSTILANIFLFLINLLAGRWLGPDQYGRAILVLTAAQLLVIPMLLGTNTALTKFLASNSKESDSIIASGLRIILVGVILTVSVAWNFQKNIAHGLHLDSQLIPWAIAISLILVLNNTGDAIVRGLHKFSTLARWQIIAAGGALITFLILFATRIRSYQTFAAAYGMNALIIASVGLSFISINSLRRIELKKWFRPFLHYALYAMFGGLAGFFLGNIDRLMLNAYLNPSQVGIYAAYMSASTALTNQGLQMFLNVFFPTAAKLDNSHRGVVNKLIRLGYLGFGPLLIVNVSVTGAVIYLFGNQFPLRFDYLVVFAVAASLYPIWNVLWWLINSTGLAGIRYTSWHTILAASLNAGLNFVLIPRLGIIGALIATIIASLYLYLQARRFLNNSISILEDRSA